MLLSNTVINKWNPSIKKYYVEKGYQYTKMRDTFEVKVDDLSSGSNVFVEVKCDSEYCEDPYLQTLWFNYNKCVKENGKYYCHKCSTSNPMGKALFDIGYIGIGEYKSRDINDNSIYKRYRTWYNMFNRCYSDKLHLSQPTYIDCTVCDEWHNFQVFAKWYDENYYEVDEILMHLDKDILVKGNKIYSPETCVFAPENINALFTKSNSIRGLFPIGVISSKKGKYESHCNRGRGEPIYLGIFDTPEEAFDKYKITKENYIKQVAEEYKNKIPQKLYNALISYEVNIND